MQHTPDTLAQDFMQLRGYLTRLAYNVLGVRQEAEDIVQDVVAGMLAKVQEIINTDVESSSLASITITNPKAYFGRAVLNRALNRKHTMQREIAASYWGVWLPEPEVHEFTTTPTFDQHSVSLGLLRLMEILTPSERAVYVLVELFEESYADTAQMLDISQETARKQLQRAKEKLEGGKQRFTASRERHVQFFQAFSLAMQEGSIDELRSLLKEDACSYSDGGGKVVASRIVVQGREKCILALLNIAEWAKKAEPATWLPCWVNGRIGASARHNETGRIITILTLEADDDGITELYSVRNPDKLPLV